MLAKEAASAQKAVILQITSYMLAAEVFAGQVRLYQVCAAVDALLASVQETGSAGDMRCPEEKS